MVYNPGGMALLISFSVALTSALVTWLLADAGDAGLVAMIFIVCVIVSFVCSYLLLDRVLFSELTKLETRLQRNGEMNRASSNRFERFSQHLGAYMESTQEEIDRLRRMEAFRRDFVADISHELKTPIFAAQGFIHTLLDGAVKEKAVRKKFLKQAAKSLDDLDMLVQDLLILSQIETGQIKMRFSEIDLYALAEEVFEKFKSIVHKKGMTLRIEGPVRKVLAYADEARINQVLTNLISNAINHSDEGSEVVVGFTVRKKTVVTRVADSGTGIPAEHINRIFERFYRVDKSRSREKGGTGLGLAIVKHILEGHDSRAKVKSEPGKGSTFSFKLPRTSKPENGDSQSNERATD